MWYCRLCTVSGFYIVICAIFCLLNVTLLASLFKACSCKINVKIKQCVSTGYILSAAAMISNRCWSSFSYHTPAKSTVIVPLYIPDWTFVHTDTTLCNMCAFWEAAYFQVPCSSDVTLEKNPQTAQGS